MQANPGFLAAILVAALCSVQAMAGDMKAVLDPGGNFLVQNASSNLLLQVQSGGNVGIGTASPVGALHIKRDGGTLYLHAASSAGGSDLTWLNEGGSAMWAFSLRPGQRNLELYRNGGGTPVLSFERANGRVGIGNTAPQATLDVAGNALLSSYGTYGTPTLSLPLGQQYIRLGDRGALQSWPGEGLVGTFLTHNALHQGSVGWKNAANAGYSMIQAGTGNITFYAGGSPGAAETVFSPSQKMIIDANGNVGIGTAAPDARLATYCGTLGSTAGASISLANMSFSSANLDQFRIEARRSTTASNPGWDTADIFLRRQVDATPVSYLRFGVWDLGLGSGSNADRLTIGASGNVGIGITAPQTKLHVNGGNLFLQNRDEWGVSLMIRNDSSTNTWRWVTGGPGGDVNVPGGGMAIHHDEHDSPLQIKHDGTVFMPVANVGIGTSSPGSKLSSAGSIRLQGAGLRIIGFNTSAPYALGSSGGSAIFFDDVTTPGSQELAFETHHAGVSHAERMRIDKDGRVGIGTATPQATLHVNGNARVDGTQTVRVLSITGGADVAEPFAVSGDEIPAGAVVVIDDENPGRLKLSDRACDRRVAGVVSGAGGVNPGLTLSQQGVLDGGRNVALSGRVYALADATSGPIEPGDLLTTSPTPGHAMKVTDHMEAQGAILGKAMSRMDSGRGLVLVLVTLQ